MYVFYLMTRLNIYIYDITKKYIYCRIISRRKHIKTKNNWIAWLRAPEAHALERKCSIIETLEHDHLPISVIAVSMRANRERESYPKR